MLVKGAPGAIVLTWFTLNEIIFAPAELLASQVISFGYVIMVLFN